MLDFQPSPTTSRFAFTKHDEVRINDRAYRPIDRTENGYIFVPADGEGVATSFTHSEMARLVALGHVEHIRNAFLPEKARARIEAPSDLLSTRPAEEHWRAKSREAVVLAFFAEEQAGNVKRTDASIKERLSHIRLKAGEFLSVPSALDHVSLDANVLVVPKTISPRSLRRWVKAYENYGLSGLYDAITNRGNRTRRLSPDALALMHTAVRGFLTSQKTTKEKICEDVDRAFKQANEERARKAKGKPDLLVKPSRETVRRAIASLDPFHCDVAREGLETARRKHAPVGRGLEVTRPLERVEMDAWTVDLETIMAESGLIQHLSDEDKALLGLDKKKCRMRLTVAICVATRCIVGMRLSKTARSDASIATLDMMVRDKGVWADAVGALSPWNMGGVPETLFTDCGSEFISYAVRVAARDMGIRIEHAPAGHPEMRAHIERFFRTISVNLMQRLTGRTFGDMIEKGDYDPKARAALTADDLCAVLIRWVVDYYHRTPHEGLGGETPGNCWDRLTKQFGVSPAPSTRRRRLAFGTHRTMTVSKTGINIFGVRYHSDVLAAWKPHTLDPVVNVRWYAEDIGAIAVELDGTWVQVPAVFARFNGVRAQTWLAAARALKASYRRQAVLDEDVVFAAIADIERINGNAMARIGLLVDDFSEERILREEDNLFIGFRCQATDRSKPKPASDTAWGDEIPTGSHDADDVAESTAKYFEDSFSAPADSNARPDRVGGVSSSQGSAETGPDLQFEDKT